VHGATIMMGEKGSNKEKGESTEKGARCERTINKKIKQKRKYKTKHNFLVLSHAHSSAECGHLLHCFCICNFNRAAKRGRSIKVQVEGRT